jgi:hypothetical protein
MELAEEGTELGGKADPSLIRELCIAGLGTGQMGGAIEGPGVEIRRASADHRYGDRHRKQWREPRQQLELTLETTDCDAPAREAEYPLPVDEPDDVVPALCEPFQRGGGQLWELLVHEAADEALVGLELRSPSVHAGSLEREQSHRLARR